MKLRPASLVPPAIAAGVAALLAWMPAARLTPVEKVEAITYDWRVWLAQRTPGRAVTNLGFVDINEDSITAIKDHSLGFSYGLYWPRHIYGRVLRELHAQGARAVAFDVLFGELREDHAAPLVATNRSPDLAAFWRALHPGEVPATIQDRGEHYAQVDSDEYFAWQLNSAGMAILAADRGVLPPPLFSTNAAAIGDISAERDVGGVLRRVRAFRLYRQWHRVFLEAVDKYHVDLAQAKVEPERILLWLPDGTELPPIALDDQGRFALADLIGEKLPPGLAPRAQPFTDLRIWHMGIVLAAAELKLDLARADVDLAAGRITLRGTNGIKRVIPVDRDGYFYIDWSLPVSDDRLTAQNFATLLRKDRDRESGQTNDLPELWKDKLVVIGSTATGNDLTDLGATPLAKETFLLSKHWNVANSVIQNRFIRRTTPGEELAILLLMGALAAGLTLALRPPWSSLAVALTGAVYVGLAVWLYVQSRLWLPLLLPVAGGLVLTHGGILAYQAFFEQREKRRVKSVFSKIVSPNVVHELLQAEKLSLGGARREVTVFFADVRGFTELTDVSQEKVAESVRRQGLTGDAAEACFAEQARETLATVNLYLATVADQVKKHDGTLDKYIGDCVMAFWGAPTAMPQHALACVRAAIDAQRAVAALNERRAAENKRLVEENANRAAAGQPPLPLHALLQLGTGINTGLVTVGLMGSDQHILNYTVFGREVNLASRLETVSGRGRIIISEATHEHLRRDDPPLVASCVEQEPARPKGFQKPVRNFEVPWRGPEQLTEGDTPAAPAPAMPGLR